MNLNQLRKKIDKLDIALLKLILKRLNLAKSIGLIKKKNRNEIVDKKRENEVLEKIVLNAEGLGLDREMTEKIWGIIIDQSKSVQSNNL